MSKPQPSSFVPSEGATLAKPGPWGNLEFQPIAIEAAEELLPVSAAESSHTHWVFPKFSRDDLEKFLTSASLTPDQKRQLLTSAEPHSASGGLMLTPSNETLLSLSTNARLNIYRYLAEHGGERDGLEIIPQKSFEEAFHSSGVSTQTVALFNKLSCQYGKYLVFSGLPCLLSQIPSYEEKAHLMKVLTRQQTFLVRLRVTPDSDIEALAAYWGKDFWSTDIKAMLESLKALRSGGTVDITDVLPPFPAASLYTYPALQNPINGARVRMEDSPWSSLNFFRDPPDPRFDNPEVTWQTIQNDYYPVPADSRYGDVVLFSKPDGEIIHSAVYLADGTVFTKNGESVLHPWMLSTISDLLDEYSFSVPPPQRLTVKFYRNKYT